MSDEMCSRAYWERMRHVQATAPCMRLRDSIEDDGHWSDEAEFIDDDVSPSRESACVVVWNSIYDFAKRMMGTS